MKAKSIVAEGVQHYLHDHDQASALLLAQATGMSHDIALQGCAVIGGPALVRIATPERLTSAFGTDAARRILAWRQFSESTANIPKGMRLKSSRDVAAYLMAMAEPLANERMWLITTNNQQRICSTSIIAEGAQAFMTVDPSRVARVAIAVDAHGVVLAHNHPSGSVEPSKEDIEFTRTIKRVLDVVGVTLLDHVIVSATQSYSMLDAGLIGNE